MATFNKFNAFVEDLAEGVHNLQTGSLRVMLTNTAPVATNSVKADIVEITAKNGYAAGGLVSAMVTSAQTAGTYKLVLTDIVFTATAVTDGTGIGPFRYAVVFNDTPTSPLDPLIGWYDYGSSITLNAGETLTVDFDGTNGVLTLA